MHVSIVIAQYLHLMTVHGCIDILLGKTGTFSSLGWSCLNTLLKYFVHCFSAILSILCSVQLC